MLQLHYSKGQKAQIFEKSGSFSLTSHPEERSDEGSHEILRPFGPQDDQSKTRAKNTSTGQIFLEYVIVIGAVVLIMFAMSTLIKRGTQGMVKVVADQVGSQINAEQQFGDNGFLESLHTSTQTTSNKTKTEFVRQTTYTFDDETTTGSDVLINMGFREEN